MFIVVGKKSVAHTRSQEKAMEMQLEASSPEWDAKLIHVVMNKVIVKPSVSEPWGDYQEESESWL